MRSVKHVTRIGAIRQLKKSETGNGGWRGGPRRKRIDSSFIQVEKRYFIRDVYCTRVPPEERQRAHVHVDTHEYTRHHRARYRLPFYRSRNPIPSTMTMRIPRGGLAATFGVVLMLDLCESSPAWINVSQLNSAVPLVKRVSHDIANVWSFELVYIMPNTVRRIIKRVRNSQICRRTKTVRKAENKIFYARYFIIS